MAITVLTGTGDTATAILHTPMLPVYAYPPPPPVYGYYYGGAVPYGYYGGTAVTYGYNGGYRTYVSPYRYRRYAYRGY